jgi:hypothetical protein
LLLIAHLAPVEEQKRAAYRCRKALAVLVKEYPKIYDRKGEGWDGDPNTLGLVGLDEMYASVVAFEDWQEELLEPKC